MVRHVWSPREMSVNHERGRVAALSRSRTADDPELVTARINLRAEMLTRHVAKVVAQAPPLTPEQRDRIAALLRSGASGGDAA